MDAMKVLVVDDDPGVLSALKRVLSGEGFDVTAVSSGEEALERANSETYAVVVSDQRMPGMTGVEILEKLREVSPDTVRILLTGYADIDAVIGAINRGQVWRYLTKPWNNDELVACVRQACETFRLVRENRELFETVNRQNEELRVLNEHLEEKVRERTEEIRRKNEVLKKLYDELDGTFREIVALFSNFVELGDRDEATHSRMVARISSGIAKKMGLPDDVATDLEVASLLHDVGKVLLPRTVMEKRPIQMTEEEFEEYRKHPLLGALAVGGMKRLERAALFIRHHHEFFDGSGFPAGLKGREIPLGGRVIAVADAVARHLDYSERGEGHSVEFTANYLLRRKESFFDPDVVNAAVEFLNEAREDIVKRETLSLSFDELTPGAVLAEDLVTESGIIIAPEGTRLTEEVLERARGFHEFDPISRQVKVFGESASS